jgi:transposase-like protein
MFAMINNTAQNNHTCNWHSSPLDRAAPSREGAAGPKPLNSPDPEVQAHKARRRFTAKYKLQILAEVDSCSQQGEIGALLRREGLYSSYLTLWRKQRKEGVLNSVDQKRGRKTAQNKREQKRIDELERENAKLRDRVKKAETIIDVQKKISKILESHQDPDENDGTSS